MSSEPTPEHYEVYAHDGYYAGAWQHYRGDEPAGLGFNVAAAVFGIHWCFYRKLYVEGLMVLATSLVAVFVLAFALGLTMPALGNGPSFPYIVGVLAWLAVRVPFGMLADRIYHRKASRLIRKVLAQGLGEPEAIECIRGLGGTQPLAVAASIAIILLLRYLGL